jgi:rhodanese-related sulfurtransferase
LHFEVVVMAQELPFNGVPVVEAELLAQEMESARDVHVVDVRDTTECLCVGWIAGARRFPLRQLRGRLAEIDAFKRDRVVVVSTRGVTAHGAAAALVLAGFSDVAVLRGGMTRWLSLGLPVVHASRPPLP